jgi:hypothetical protein
MMPVELLLVIAAVVVLGVIAVGLLKALFWFVLLPIKLGFWMLKGAFGLAFMVGLGLLCLGALAFVPLVITVVALPVIAVVCGVIALIRLV